MSATEYGVFAHGGATYPLSSTANGQLLKDADPALYYAADFWSTMITTYIGPRLIAEAADANVSAPIPKAVATMVSFDPAPYLQETQFAFPVLAVYRKSEKYERKTVSWMRDIGEWIVEYILPPLSPGQAQRLLPALRAAGSVLVNRTENMFDPNYASGARVWGAGYANLEEISFVEGKYGLYAGAGNLAFYGLQQRVTVKERDMPIATQFPAFAGLDAAVDLASPVAPTVYDVADVASQIIDPTTLGLVEFVRGDSGLVAAADGAHLATWTDASTTAANFTAATAAPSILAGALVIYSGDTTVTKSVIRNDNLAQSYAAATNANVSVDTGKTYLVLARMLNTTARGAILAHTKAADTGGATISIEANTASGAGGKFGLQITGSSYDTAVPVDTNWHVFAYRVSSSTAGGTITGTSDFHIDGSAALLLTLKSGAGTWSTMAASNQLAIGAIPGLPATAGAVDVAVVMVAASYLSDANLFSATQYCQRWLTQP